MHILLISRNFPPRTCGVGDYTSCLAEQLVAAGERVTVLTEPSDRPRRVAFGLRELPLGGWRDIRAAAEEVASFGADRVQLEYSAYGWSRWGAAWRVNALLFRLRRRGIPVHVGLHELAVSMRKHPLQTPFVLAQWTHLALLVAAAEAVSVNMRSRLALLGRLFPWWREKFRYRPNSSNIPVVPLAPGGREAFRRERGVAPGERVIATFGLFHPAKNYEGLIAAIATLRRVQPVRLWMLGNLAAASSDYIARLKQAARNSGIESAMWWPGELPAAGVSKALQSADVFVLPQDDGHLTRSGAFMAAAAHGLPVVAVRQPGGRDQAEFSHGKNVWLVERSSAEEIAAAILALMADPSGAALSGESLRRLYETHFAWHVTVAAERNRGKAAPSADESSEPGTVATATTVGGAKS